MYSLKIGKKVLVLGEMKVYEILAVRHVTYESKKTYFVNTYYYLGRQKWVNSKGCAILNKRKSR